jgi:hypothetical protein
MAPLLPGLHKASCRAEKLVRTIGKANAPIKIELEKGLQKHKISVVM